jgi:hypothetical protein
LSPLQDYQIRLLDVDKYKSSKTLLESCGTFLNNMQQLQESVSSYMSIVNQQVSAVPRIKPTAAGSLAQLYVCQAGAAYDKEVHSKK